jgi:hypothetical protein
MGPYLWGAKIVGVQHPPVTLARLLVGGNELEIETYRGARTRNRKGR